MQEERWWAKNDEQLTQWVYLRGSGGSELGQ